MEDHSTLDYMRSAWQDQKEAVKYSENRFSSSRRWRWTDKKEREILDTILGAFESKGLGLDAPCGAGRLAACFQRAGHAWIGADVSQEMVCLARQRVKGLVVVADITALPFRERTFDFVVCVRLLHRIQDRGIRLRILGELSRVTSGPVVVTYYTRWNLRGIQRQLRGKFPGLSLDTIQTELRQAGLRLLKRVPLGRLLHQQWFFVASRKSPGLSHTTQGMQGSGP